jgi:hypothetical protein
MTRGGYAIFPATPSQRMSHILFYTGTRVMGVFDSDCSLGGGGYACHPSPLTDRSSPAQNAHNRHWRGPRTRPHLPHVSPPPCTQLDKTVTGRLNGRTFRVFSYTHVRQYSPIGLYNWLNNYEIEVILVFHEDVFIADLQRAMTRPEML